MRLEAGATDGACDSLNDLPESLLLLILSKLPIREAVRCSVVSRRWKNLWTRIPHLDLRPETVLSRPFDDDELELQDASRKFEQMVNDILLFHCGPLQSFRLEYEDEYDGRIAGGRSKVWKWIRSAALRKVQQLTLKISAANAPIPWTVFSLERLTFLEVSNYELVGIPVYFNGFRCLKTCILRFVVLDDESLEQLVARCPVLQNLTVEHCYGLYNPNICAPNLKYLALIGDGCPSILRGNCPQLIELVVEDFFPLMKSFRRQELFSSLKALKKLSLRGNIYLKRLNDFITAISDQLQDLTIHGTLSFVGLEAHGVIPHSAFTSSLAKLQEVMINLEKWDIERDIALFGFLLRSSPSLKNMTIIMPKQCKKYVQLRFLKNLLSLHRASAEARIFVL